MAETPAATVQTRLTELDRARLGPFHTRLLLVAGVSWMWAALGVSIVGVVIPALRAEWGLTSSQAGLIASAGLVGMMVGAVLAGIWADRFGRRGTLALVMVWMGVFSALSAAANSYAVLLILRLLTGLGLGAVLPVASTLLSEYSPARYRGTLLVLLNGFWGLGSALAALVGYALVGRYGWRPALLFTSIAVISAPLVQFLLPESVRYLMEKGRLNAALAALRGVRVSPDPAAAARVQPASPLPAPKTEGSTAPSIWVQPYLGRTITLWVLWFALNFTFQGVFVWLPTLLIAGGNSLSRAYLLALVISLGQVPGTLLAAFLADRVSRRLSIAAFLVLWGISVFLFGLSAGPASLLFWGFLLAIWNGAAWGVAYPFTTELYPTRIRGAATGWASGFGRTGGILAPWLVGVLIQASSGSAVIFALLGAVPALTSLALAGLRQDTTGRALEEISDRSA